MAWVKTTDLLPAENEPVLVHDGRRDRMETGRLIRGRWYVEDARDGRLREIADVTHWAPLLDSYLHDDSEDD